MKFLAPAEQLCIRTPLIKLCLAIFLHYFLLLLAHCTGVSLALAFLFFIQNHGAEAHTSIATTLVLKFTQNKCTQSGAWNQKSNSFSIFFIYFKSKLFFFWIDKEVIVYNSCYDWNVNNNENMEKVHKLVIFFVPTRGAVISGKLILIFFC